MNVNKFHGRTTREALRKVKEALGEDAVILSNRRVGDEIEIMAVAEAEVSRLTEPPAQAEQPALRQNRAEAFRRPAPVAPAPAYAPAPASAPAHTASAAAPSGPTALPESLVLDMMREMRTMRGMLEGQLAGLAWSDLSRREPARLDVLRSLLAAGFGPSLSRQLSDNVPPGSDNARAMAWVKAALMHNLRVIREGADLVTQGGVYALVGPTGVGKTTTVAKLAARCALRFGPSHVAMLTTDNYRIGAHEHLKIYGKILGVPVHPVTDAAEMQSALADFRNKHLILIDTVGMSQRDVRLAEQIAMLSGHGRNVRRLLLLNAGAQGSTLDDVVRAYREGGLDGCVLTKADEAVNMGAVLDAVIRYKLAIHYVANGQRVPEDLRGASALYLVDRAFKAKPTAAFEMEEVEYPLMLAGVTAEDYLGTAAKPADKGSNSHGE